MTHDILIAQRRSARPQKDAQTERNSRAGTDRWMYKGVEALTEEPVVMLMEQRAL